MLPRSMMSVCALAFFLPATLQAGQEAFEVMDPKADSLAYCQSAHRIIDCTTYHIAGITVSTEGPVLDLDGRRYIVEWTGPGYYLDSGVILQPLGETKAGLGGQRWLEVYPEPGKIHTSQAWQDQDGNRALSVSDTLTLGDTRKAARPFKVKDVRLQFRASPASEGAERNEKPEGAERERQQ